MTSQDDIVAPFLTVGAIIIQPAITLSVMFFAYGMYTTFFGLCVHAFVHRDRPTARLVYMGWIVTLFVLATIYTATNTWKYTRQSTIEFTAAATRDNLPLLSILCSSITSIIANLMNATVESMFIYRCYVIWDCKGFVLYPLAFAAFVLNAMDLGCIISRSIGIIDPSKHSNDVLVGNATLFDNGVVIGIAVFQVVLTLMIAYRVRQPAGWLPTSYTKYTAIITIESGLLYAVPLVISTILTSVMDNNRTGLIIPVDFTIISVLMSGIASTLVVLYGKSTNQPGSKPKLAISVGISKEHEDSLVRPID